MELAHHFDPESKLIKFTGQTYPAPKKGNVVPLALAFWTLFFFYEMVGKADINN